MPQRRAGGRVPRYLVLGRNISPGSEQEFQTADVASFGGEVQRRHTLLQLVRGAVGGKLQWRHALLQEGD